MMNYRVKLLVIDGGLGRTATDFMLNTELHYLYYTVFLVSSSLHCIFITFNCTYVAYLLFAMFLFA